MSTIELMQGMTDNQRMLFQTRYQAAEKSPTTTLLLTLFLGGLGAHRFYLGDTGIGVVYLLFFWTLIPALVAFVELFMVQKRTREYNRQRAQEIAAEVRALAPAGG